MQIKYTCTYWGCENLGAKNFLEKVIANGYQGVEINFPEDESFIKEFMVELGQIRKEVNPGFVFIAQQVLPNKNESPQAYGARMRERLEFLVSLNPDYINSHTGKDYFEFDENSEIISLAEQISKSAGIPIWHEIHRGRFSFHSKTLLQYLQVFPDLKLVADFSHFCVVSESNLTDQHPILSKIYPHIRHIHARIGFSQSPQVNNPFAPEWKNELAEYLQWWKEIIEVQHGLNLPEITITPEFGPFPYMPQEPFTQNPLSDQWQINLDMKSFLQSNLVANS